MFEAITKMILYNDYFKFMKGIKQTEITEVFHRRDKKALCVLNI